MPIFTLLDQIEYPLVAWLQSIDGTFLDSLSRLVSNTIMMFVVFWMIILLYFWWHRQTWKPLIIALILSIVLALIINEWFFKTLLVEFGIFRPRPYTIHPDLLQIGKGFLDSSFPSSHMAFTTLFVVVISHFKRWFLKYGILMILLMWLSRVHNGMHYPTDVLVGTVMGTLYGIGGLSLMQKLGIEKR